MHYLGNFVYIQVLVKCICLSDNIRSNQLIFKRCVKTLQSKHLFILSSTITVHDWLAIYQNIINYELVDSIEENKATIIKDYIMIFILIERHQSYMCLKCPNIYEYQPTTIPFERNYLWSDWKIIIERSFMSSLLVFNFIFIEEKYNDLCLIACYLSSISKVKVCSVMTILCDLCY